MTKRELILRRLQHQQIGSSRATTPAQIVSAFGAVQAQDYTSTLWAVGARLPGSTEADVERAIAERKIVRTWPMRGTLHLVTAADIRWMLALLTPRILSGATNRERALGLDAGTYARCRKIFAKALEGDHQLTREAMLALLEKSGVRVDPRRGYHILWRLSQEGFLCCASRFGKQQTFALLDEWIPFAHSRALTGTEALAELATRYFTSRGPATIKDFVWWTGLKVSDAKTGIAAATKKLSQHTIDGVHHWMSVDSPALQNSSSPSAHLLPAFDEYLLGYRDRSAVLNPAHVDHVMPGGNGMFLPICLSRGRVVATWKRTVGTKKTALTLNPFAALASNDRRSIETVANRYGEFLGRQVEIKN